VKLIYERYICVLKGKEQFKLVSPIYRGNIYVGAFDKLKKHETPVNFFDVDSERFPYAQLVNFLTATLNAGDCMYVPAFYYIQSRTLEDSTILSQ
jgi:hypothetical protein